VTRAGRFYIVAGVLNRFGVPLKVFIEKNLTAVGLVTLLAIIGGFAAVKFLF
jgi:hypothetical protein